LSYDGVRTRVFASSPIKNPLHKNGEPLYTLRSDCTSGRVGYPCHPNWTDVFRLWQFAQRTSHFSISVSIRHQGNPWE